MNELWTIFFKKIFKQKTVWENVFCVELSVPYKAFDMQIRRHANDSLEEKERTNYKTPVKFIDNIDPQRKWRENEAGKKTWAWAHNDAAPLRGRNTVLSVNCFSVFEATGKYCGRRRIRTTGNDFRVSTKREHGDNGCAFIRRWWPSFWLLKRPTFCSVWHLLQYVFFFIWDDDHVTWLSWNLSGYLSSYLAK